LQGGFQKADYTAREPRGVITAKLHSYINLANTLMPETIPTKPLQINFRLAKHNVKITKYVCRQ